ncbi:unnamed protein product [Symbiodinium natans]|uniref:Uncharacterized protein n=1 Tax=Symbiodinium natans TaxID=878477 RepID=A0A812LXK0_9DINO|nr:unnamed protein product [Symbiodinium natans]
MGIREAARHAARSARLVLGGATAGVVTGAAGAVQLAQNEQSGWWASQASQFFQKHMLNTSAATTQTPNARDVLYQRLACVCIWGCAVEAKVAKDIQTSVLRQKMTALELVSEMQREEIVELIAARKVAGTEAAEEALVAPGRAADADAESKAAQLAAQLDLERRRADLAEEKLGHLYNELNELQGLRAVEHKARQDLRGELAQKADELNKAQQVLTERMQEIEGVKKSSSDDIAALQKTVESQRLENTKLGQSYSELKEREAKKEQTITELQRLRIAEERGRTELQGQLKQKASELTQLQKALEDTTQEMEDMAKAKDNAISSVEAKLTAKQLENEKLGKMCSQLQSAGEKQEAKIAELHEAQSIVQKAREDLEGQLTEKASQMAQLQKDLDAVSQEMEQTEKSKSEALASMEKALDAQRIESDKLGELCSELKSEDERKDAKIAELQSLYASEQKGREEVQGQLEQKTQDLGRVNQGLEIAMRDMLAFKASKAEDRGLDFCLKSYDALVQEMQLELAALRAREEEASTQLHKLQSPGPQEELP